MYLFTVMGPDKPGISHEIASVIAQFPETAITNIGQSALGGWLSLTFSIETTARAWKDIKSEIEKKAHALKLHTDFTERKETLSPTPHSRYAITLL